jgi:hypothetical protein
LTVLFFDAGEFAATDLAYTGLVFLQLGQVAVVVLRDLPGESLRLFV